eukprot:gene34948-45227_t
MRGRFNAKRVLKCFRKTSGESTRRSKISVYRFREREANPAAGDKFMLSMAGSVMKPLIPGNVTRGIERIETDAMKETIKACCFSNEGLLSIARQLDTYNRSKIEFPGDIAEVPIPEGVETEENLGPVTEEEPTMTELDAVAVAENNDVSSYLSNSYYSWW